MSVGAPFGPWRDLPAAERVAQLRELRAIAALIIGRDKRLVALLRAAESDSDALEQAWLELERLPALPRRRVLAALAHIGAPR